METLNETFEQLSDLFFYCADSRQTRTKIPHPKIAVMKQEQSYFIIKDRMSLIFLE